jgi:predicted MFS family arabinose efflux permease
MPVGDWQFWIVTVIAVAAMWVMIRVLLPRRKPRSKKTELTVGGKRLEK